MSLTAGMALGIATSLAGIYISCWVVSAFISEDNTALLPGPSTHGHYQIELRCDACHAPSGSVDENKCLGCHQQELDQVEDSHPAKKFNDPRNADRLAIIDAQRCTACHSEHRPEMTGAMGLTLPQDYCWHCHADIGEERPSHQGLSFMTCQSAGCHNYHDNKALYEDFLIKHADEPDHKHGGTMPDSTLAARWKRQEPDRKALQLADIDSPHGDDSIHKDWLMSAHARAGVNCSDCHGPKENYIAKPGVAACAKCHQEEHTGFLAGKHGMRLANDLSPMTPAMARRDMKATAAHKQLDCNSCHQSHRYDRQFAAVSACIQCHDDAHSKAYENSPHHQSWLAEIAGTASKGSGVSCATCHMPRVHGDGRHSDEVFVTHNQNQFLRPVESMVRSSCLNCHGLGFSLDALADPALIHNNFTGRPAKHIPSIDWAKARQQE